MKFQKDAQEIQADHNETEVVSQEDAEQQVEPIVPQPVAQPVAQPTILVVLL